MAGSLPYDPWRAWLDTIHMRTQVVARVAAGGSYHPDLRKFVLPWASADAAVDGDEVLAFLRSAYAAAAGFGRWDRRQLEP